MITVVSKYRFVNAHTAATLLGTPASCLLTHIAQHRLSTWSRQPPEDQPEHQKGERRLKGLWTWHGCQCLTGWSEYFSNCWVSPHNHLWGSQRSEWVKCLVDARQQSSTSSVLWLGPRFADLYPSFDSCSLTVLSSLHRSTHLRRLNS